MSDLVIDTNVWVMADRKLSADMPQAEIECIRACREWLAGFVDACARLVVDLSYRILSEYRRNISPNGFAAQHLNRLESNSKVRCKHVDVDFDRDGHAVLPVDIEVRDPADRKFVAASIQCQPPAPIYNASDSDWAAARTSLSEHNIAVHELCPNYVAARTCAE